MLIYSKNYVLLQIFASNLHKVETSKTLILD